MNDRATFTILAALRHWQNSTDSSTSDIYPPETLIDTATNGGELVLMSGDELDELCEFINCGGLD